MEQKKDINQVNEEIENQLLNEMELRKQGIDVIEQRKSRKKRLKYRLMLMAPILIILLLKIFFIIMEQIN